MANRADSGPPGLENSFEFGLRGMVERTPSPAARNQPLVRIMAKPISLESAETLLQTHLPEALATLVQSTPENTPYGYPVRDIDPRLLLVDQYLPDNQIIPDFPDLVPLCGSSKIEYPRLIRTVSDPDKFVPPTLNISLTYVRRLYDLSKMLGNLERNARLFHRCYAGRALAITPQDFKKAIQVPLICTTLAFLDLVNLRSGRADLCPPFLLRTILNEDLVDASNRHMPCMMAIVHVMLASLAQYGGLAQYIFPTRKEPSLADSGATSADTFFTSVKVGEECITVANIILDSLTSGHFAKNIESLEALESLEEDYVTQCETRKGQYSQLQVKENEAFTARGMKFNFVNSANVQELVQAEATVHAEINKLLAHWKTEVEEKSPSKKRKSTEDEPFVDAPAPKKHAPGQTAPTFKKPQVPTNVRPVGLKSAASGHGLTCGNMTPSNYTPISKMQTQLQPDTNHSHFPLTPSMPAQVQGYISPYGPPPTRNSQVRVYRALGPNNSQHLHNMPPPTTTEIVIGGMRRISNTLSTPSPNISSGTTPISTPESDNSTPPASIISRITPSRKAAEYKPTKSAVLTKKTKLYAIEFLKGLDKPEGQERLYGRFRHLNDIDLFPRKCWIDKLKENKHVAGFRWI